MANINLHNLNLDPVMSDINLDNISRRLVSIEYIRVNKIDGIEFVEIKDDGIEYVLVNKIDDEIDDEKPVQIYGTVLVRAAIYGDQIAYDRSSNNPESKVPGQYLSLTGPSMPVWAEDPFFISVCFWFHDDDEIVKGEVEGEIGWERRIPPYDQLVHEEITGKYGSVSIGYWVITKALYATINIVMMINGEEESSPVVAVYGTIKATLTFYDGSLMTRMLFDKSENEYVQVSPQRSIPLTRPFFPIGVDSYLTIATDLWDHDSLSPYGQIALPSLSPDDQIALDTVEFDPIMGTQNKNITSKYGELQVSFTCAF